MDILSLELNITALCYISMPSLFASMFSRLDIAQIGNFCAFGFRVKFSPCRITVCPVSIRY